MGSEESSESRETKGPDNTINELQFLLEYVHAVLASDVAPDESQFDEVQCAELFALSSKLKEQALFFAMASSADTENEDFGPSTQLWGGSSKGSRQVAFVLSRNYLAAPSTLLRICWRWSANVHLDTKLRV